jgi:hypothetical protein
MEGAFPLLGESLPGRLHLLGHFPLQGMQMMHDTSIFGGFSHAFLISFRDEFLKALTLNFSLISYASPNHAGIDNVSERALT